jgi:hypothetical protein
MQDSGWSQALSELAASITQALIRLWKQDIVQVCLAIGMFLALSAPILIVILLLWYIDSTGWRPSGGFYKIGFGSGDPLLDPSVYAAGVNLLFASSTPIRSAARRTCTAPT